MALLSWFLADGGIFAQLKFHGNTTWSTAQSRVAGPLLGVVGISQRNRRIHASRGMLPRHLRGRHALSTYQGFMAAIVRWTSRLIEASLVAPSFQKMEEIGGKFWRIGDWVPIAFDGSRSSAPRTVANEQAYCATNYGKGKTARYRKKKSKGMRRKANQKNKPQPQEPQAWITMLWHMGLRLPWMWRLGPSNSSERAHVMEW